MAPLDAKVLKRSKGRFGLMGNYGLPQCLVTTIGRKSGLPRTVTLVYGTLNDDLILVGSNFGQKHDPAWALNLEANPEAEISIHGESQRMAVRKVTDPDELERIWHVMCAMWPAYNAYRERAGREIKVFALTPDAGGVPD